MLLELHEKYTIYGLNQIESIDKKIANEILKGSFVNDLCELTNRYKKTNTTMEQYIQEQKENGLLDYSAFYQSHWGQLTALHCMSNINNEAPEIIQKNIFNWLDFLEFLIFNVNEEILNIQINQFQNILGNSVKDLKFKISSLLDTDDIFEAKYRAMGMIIHIIEDSYTVSHCKRDNSNIISFYCYLEQSAIEHKKNDFVLLQYEEQMLSDIYDVLTQLLNESSANSNYQKIFQISSSALPSSSGRFQ